MWNSLSITMVSDLPNLQDQHEKRSTTSLGITHWTPNKIKTIFQSSWATLQYMSRWLTNSPPNLHMQHQSIIITLLFRRLSMVRILPKAGVQLKLCHFSWHFRFPHSSPQKVNTIWLNQNWIKGLYLKYLATWWVPTKRIQVAPSNRIRINELHEQKPYFHFPNLKHPWKLNVPMTGGTMKPEVIRHLCLRSSG